MFLQAANPNSEGKTRLWLYSELEVMYPGVEFQTNNGGDWNRSDGVLKDYIIHREKRGVKCIGIRLDGHKDTSIEKRIKPSISKAIKDVKFLMLVAKTSSVIIKMEDTHLRHMVILRTKIVMIFKHFIVMSTLLKEPIVPDVK